MKKLSAILCFMLSIILFSACTEQGEPEIFVLDPTLGWLNEKILQIEGSTNELNQYTYINTEIYDGGRVFIFISCCPYCNTVMTVYNLEGEFLGIISLYGNDSIPNADISDQKLYWKPKNSVCNV